MSHDRRLGGAIVSGVTVVAEDEDATFSCSNCCDSEVALDSRRDIARDECRERAAEPRRETAGEGGAGREEVRDALCEFDREDLGVS